MKKDVLKPRLIPTHSQKFLFVNLFILIPLSAVFLVALIIMGMCKDYFIEGMYLAWVFIPVCAVVLIALTLVIVPLVISPIDTKKHGKGIYTVKFDCDFTEEKRLKVTNLLSGLGFLLNNQKETWYFTKSITINNGSSCCHITICQQDGKMEIAAYMSGANIIAGNVIGLYGYHKITMKNNLRRIVALTLNTLEAPPDAKV